MKLSAATVRSAGIPAGKIETIYFDDHVPGFGLRIREGGSRSFIFQYKLGVKQRRMALGTATALNIGAARKTAEQLYARVKLAQDPAGDKADARASAAKTFIAAAGDFLAQKRGELRDRSYPDLERHVLKHAKTLHELQLAKITRRDIAPVIASVTKNSGAVTANRVRTSLSTFFSWTMEQGLADINPVIGTARNKEQSRERVLTPAELRLIWANLGDDDFADIIRVLAFTGQRAGEIAGLHRSEIHDGMILLPAERSKNHRAHVVPLSPSALDIINKRERRPDRDLIFGRGTKPFSGWSNCKERLDARITKANGGKEIPHWTPHDLRRTFATYAGGGLPAHQLAKLSARDKGQAKGLGIEPHIVEAILNHVSGSRSGVAGTYNRSTYEGPKRVALDLWADHLNAIVEGRQTNVTPLRRDVERA
jgi:integrase